MSDHWREIISQKIMTNIKLYELNIKLIRPSQHAMHYLSASHVCMFVYRSSLVSIPIVDGGIQRPRSRYAIKFAAF